ncbi:GAF domain-containing protein, partial [Streptomyces sp. WAC06614]|uniref:GAF domain-containing protein n=1 Tax=Streptomyces sp. WAC06614 TaxID=2487416 RepID=UPI000F78632A
MGVWGERLGPARSRERFLLGEPVEGGVRGSILHSWERCRLLGLSPDQAELPYTEDYDPDSRLVHAAGPVLDRLAARFAGSRLNICLADANGTVLERRFGEPSLARKLPPIQTVPGFVFAERVAGTNGIGLALAERRLIRVYGAEHFAERSQTNACAATPVRDQLSGEIVGVLCFGYPRDDDDPALAVHVRRAAESIERRLMELSSARERGLLHTYLHTCLDAARQAGPGGPAGGNGQGPGPVGLDELAHGRTLDPHDETILKEKAAELIGSPQRSAVEVALAHGRGVTLLSHSVTSPAGVAGVVVEAVLTGETSPAVHSLATAR